MNTVMAYFCTRRGGGGCMFIKTAADAEKILTGGHSVTAVELRTPDGEVIGKRWKTDKWNGGKWAWYYDTDFFPKQEST